jgi:uncharacterized protein (UPF0335 family)
MDLGGNSKEVLSQTVARIERLNEEKDAISSDIRDMYTEAKSNGFDVKALRRLIKLRAQDAKKREEEEAILSTYMSALGMLLD